MRKKKRPCVQCDRSCSRRWVGSTARNSQKSVPCMVNTVFFIIIKVYNNKKHRIYHIYIIIKNGTKIVQKTRMAAGWVVLQETLRSQCHVLCGKDV